MCEVCDRREERDRAFWQSIRRALLMAASAIQKRYDDGGQDSRAA